MKLAREEFGEDERENDGCIGGVPIRGAAREAGGGLLRATTHYGRPPGMQSPRSAHSAHSGNKSTVATDAAIPERPTSERIDMIKASELLPMTTFMVGGINLQWVNKRGDDILRMGARRVGSFSSSF